MATQKTEILILPYPIQGHINPMLQFSKRLASKSTNFVITLLLPTSQTKSSAPQTGVINNVEFINDGAQEGQKFESVEAYLVQFQKVVPDSLDELIRSRSDQSRRPNLVLIYDSFLPWALNVAHENGCAGAAFFTQTCSVSSVYYFFRQQKLMAGDDEMSLLPLPAMPRLETRDLPSFIRDKESPKILLELLVNQFSNLEKTEFVLFNSFNKLEDEMVKWMKKQWPVLTVGPTMPSMYLDKYIEDDQCYGLNLFKPNRQTCQEWLDGKQIGSVIYVSFGSMAILKQEQMDEIARCLENLQSHFIWVVRESEMSKLSAKFVEKNSVSSGLGLLVTWCNQLDVLAHKAVGCFVTHCGWNSTLEAICLGVPMVGMPNWSDQPTNAKFVADVWRIGVRANENDDGVVTGAELERCVRAVLHGDDGEEIRRNAETFKDCALAAILVGGSSDRNIDEFVSKIVSG